jgi:hypothetical protein
MKPATEKLCPLCSNGFPIETAWLDSVHLAFALAEIAITLPLSITNLFRRCEGTKDALDEVFT